MFCDRLKKNGVNVLGIGDCPYDDLQWELKNCLTEYYKVSSLANYDEMHRAVAYFAFRYGKIDWLESTVTLKKIFDRKGIKADWQIWGHDVDHDWPWWRIQWPMFLGRVLGE